MKKWNLKIYQAFFTFIVATFFAASVYADAFRFETPRLRGTGCPDGSYSVTASPDDQTMTILFDNFSAEVPQVSGDNDNDVASGGRGRGSHFDKNLAYKVCAMAIAAYLPANQRVDSFEVSIDFRGSAVVEAGSKAMFKSVFISWNGPQGRRGDARNLLVNRAWNGETEDDWSITRSKIIPVRTNCSAQNRKRVAFKINNVLKAAINRGVDANTTSALIMMDSQDMVGRMNFKIHTSRCSRGGRGGGGGNNGDLNRRRRVQCRRVRGRWDERRKRCLRRRRPRRIVHP